MPTIAAALAIPDSKGDPLETLTAALRTRELLLVVDNAEHLREAAPLYVRLLAAAPRLKLLVTSRTVLHLSGERVYPVEPLSHASALELFHERARQADAGFEPDATAERAIEKICARVDGLPLAIELAASRTRTLAPVELLRRLDSRLPLLNDGPRDLPERQRTLRATLDWSHSLLEPSEQRDFASLAVFVGGWTLDAAETVCDATVERLGGLVDHSLVQRRTDPSGRARYTMLEVVREYAIERIDRKRFDSLMRRLGDYLVTLADSAPMDGGPTRGTAPDFLAAEFDNMRAALRWALSMPEAELALRLATEFRWFGFTRPGAFSERSGWLDAALGVPGVASTRTRAQALETAARIAFVRGEFAKAIALAKDAVCLYRDLADEAASIEPLGTLGAATAATGDLSRARAHVTKCLRLATRRSLPIQAHGALQALGKIELELGNLDKAARLLEQSAAFAREEGEAPLLTSVLHGLGDVALDGGDPSQAAEFYRESIQVALGVRLWPTPIVTYGVAGLAAAAALAGESERAAHLWGGVEALERQWGTPLTPFARSRYGQRISACASVTPSAFRAAAQSASRMPADIVIERALAG